MRLCIELRRLIQYMISVVRVQRSRDIRGAQVERSEQLKSLAADPSVYAVKSREPAGKLARGKHRVMLRERVRYVQRRTGQAL